MREWRTYYEYGLTSMTLSLSTTASCERQARSTLSNAVVGLVTTVLVAVLVTGCGFHLRGKAELSPALQTLRVKASDFELRQAVEEALQFSGVTIVDATDASDKVPELELTRDDYERRVRTVDRRGLATSYYLEYRVNFIVKDSAGETLIARKNIRQRRDFDFDSTQVLQKEGEENFLKEDMQRDIAQTILRLLATVAQAQLPADNIKLAHAALAREHQAPGRHVPAG